MRRQIYPSIMMTILFTVLFGLVYPLAITGVAQVLFPRQAGGSLIEDRGRVAGSSLIGQPFSDPKYFWGRLSATSPYPYNAASSSGSNLGPTNQALLDAVNQRVEGLRKADPGNTAPVPVDLVTASGSGLDPDISPAAAQYQAGRVARVRHLPLDAVDRLIRQHTTGRQFGILGEPRVNVLQLNRVLDQVR